MVNRLAQSYSARKYQQQDTDLSLSDSKSGMPELQKWDNVSQGLVHCDYSNVVEMCGAGAPSSTKTQCYWTSGGKTFVPIWTVTEDPTD